MMKIGICKLCRNEGELQESHVIPGFLYKWLKETSATGHIRFGEQPNKRVQDGFKFYWLCLTCEQRLNVWETKFSNQVFYPILKNDSAHVKYDSWMLLFCVSISWRVLTFFLQEKNLENVPANISTHISNTEQVWRQFLMGEIEHPSFKEQHFIPFGPIGSHTLKNMPPNINRYILRSIDMDFVHSEKSAFTFSKLGRFVIIGFVEYANKKEWKGTKINANRGIIRPQSYTLPASFGDYLMEKAARGGKILEKISEAQSEKINKAIVQNIDRAAASELFFAMEQDIVLFGDNALPKK